MIDTKETKKKLSIKILFNKNAWLFLFVSTYAIFWFRLPSEIPLYYSQTLREDRLASKYALLILPGIVYGTFIIVERFLRPLALKNPVILGLLKYSGIIFAAFTYVLFLKILFLIA